MAFEKVCVPREISIGPHPFSGLELEVHYTLIVVVISRNIPIGRFLVCPYREHLPVSIFVSFPSLPSNEEVPLMDTQFPNALLCSFLVRGRLDCGSSLMPPHFRASHVNLFSGS